MIGLRVIQALHDLRVSASASSAINLMRWLRSNDHQTCMVSGDGDRSADVQAEEFQHIRFQDRGPGWWFGGRRRLIEDVRAWKPDLIHLHQMDALPIMRRIADEVGVPLVVGVQSEPSSADIAMLRESPVALVLVPSGALRSVLVGQNGLPREKVAVLPYGMDLARYPKGEGAGPISRLAAIGRFEQGSGLEVLVEAFAILRTRGADCHLTLMGAGDQSYLLTQIAESGLNDEVTLVPGVSRTGQALAKHDCFIYPALKDSLTLAVLKAMACGRPIVASATGSMTEWLHDGENGLLVPPGDRDAMVSALESLMADPDKAWLMGSRARHDVVVNHDLRLVGEAAHEIYRAALSGRSGTSTGVETEAITAYRRVTEGADAADA